MVISNNTKLKNESLYNLDEGVETIWNPTSLHVTFTKNKKICLVHVITCSILFVAVWIMFQTEKEYKKNNNNNDDDIIVLQMTCAEINLAYMVYTL